MRLRFPRVTIRLLMLVVVTLAVASAVVLPRLRQPTPPRLRYLEIYHRNPDGSLMGTSSRSYNLDEPPLTFEQRMIFLGARSSPTLHEDVERAKAAGLDYRITIPRAFDSRGRPIY